VSLRQTAAQLSPAASTVKIGTIDIETTPHQMWSFDVTPRFLGPEKMIQPSRILSFAFKWLHEKTPLIVDERDGHEAMIRQAWTLLSDADVIVTYNGFKFDVPRLQDAFRDYRLGPPAPFKHVDLIKSNRAQFDLPYRRLDYLAGRVLNASKDKTDIDLWFACMAGDAKAWDRMRAYNAKDVVLTEQLYLELLPWLVDQPHMGMLIDDGEGHRCAFCGTVVTEEMRWAKPARAFVRSYTLYRCSHCLGWNRSTLLRGTAQFRRRVR